MWTKSPQSIEPEKRRPVSGNPLPDNQAAMSANVWPTMKPNTMAGPMVTPAPRATPWKTFTLPLPTA